jgi:hypothetical protein
MIGWIDPSSERRIPPDECATEALHIALDDRRALPGDASPRQGA